MSIITKVELPTHCEYCGSELEWNSVNLVCNNTSCINKTNEDLKAWCMNLAPIEGLGWKTIIKCLESSYYKFHYENVLFNVNNIMKLEQEPGITYGKGEKGMFNKMLDILQNGNFTVSQFLLALNIPGLGKISAKRWEESGNAYNLLMSIVLSDYDIVYRTSKEYQELLDIIQDKNVVETITDFTNIYNKKIRDCYYLVENRIIFSRNQISQTSKGKVVITGSLSVKRSDFELYLRNNGWELVNNITKDVKYLITNTPNSETSKNKKANELGIEKITENDFINRFL